MKDSRVRRVALVVCLGTLTATSLAAAQDGAAHARLDVAAPLPMCTTARLGARTQSRDADSVFRFDSVAPGTHRLSCGRTLDIYLVPDARLLVRLADGAPQFEGRGASANRYLASSRRLSTRGFAQIWTAPRDSFAMLWNAALGEDQRALGAVDDAGSAFIERENARLTLRYDWGRTVYPFFHWRETDASAVVHDTAMWSEGRSRLVNDARWWPLPEHEALVDAMVHEGARVLLAEDATLRRGDARWLRAEFRAAARLFPDTALLRHVSSRLVLKHIDDNGSRGVDSVMGQWVRLRPDSALRQRADSMIRADLAMRDGHVTETYKRADGVDLELHVLRPEPDTPGQKVPAMLWFHGGSGSTGVWWHSPGVVRALRQNGVAVIGVEFRTESRFGPEPPDQFGDASDAFLWVTRHSERLGLDPRRIGAAGFSSGSTLALLLGTRGASNPARAPAAPAAPAARTYPAAVVVTGACPNPGEDAYSRKTASRLGDPKAYSPIDLIAPGQPPVLIVHATADEYCAYDDARQFIERSRAAGNAAELSSVEGAGHFFGFYYPPGQRQLREAIASALRGWGWSPRRVGP